MIICGDALTELSKLDSESVDSCITSPPYWALRDYKVAGQLGLESTIDEYVTKLVSIFDQIKRVLKRSGTCWVVIGDTYSGNIKQTGRNDSNTELRPNRRESGDKTKIVSDNNILDKSLCMIPERFAIKMIDHGWILRNKIIWYKPNCMPSSAKDRFTVDWEYVYFFVKSQKYYFETQYEPIQSDDTVGWTKLQAKDKWHVKNDMWKVGTEKRHQFRYGDKSVDGKQYHQNPLGRIKRCVWKISTKPFSGAHFAVFPPDLVEPMLRAGCPSDGIVLDPFFGAGTVGLVALQQNKRFIGIELNPEYINIANARLNPLLKQQKL